MLRRLIIDCSAQQIRAKQLNEDFDHELNNFNKYMSKLNTYIDFKQRHPYAGTHPDFEREETPVTVLNAHEGVMHCYLPDQHSKAATILTKFRTVN